MKYLGWLTFLLTLLLASKSFLYDGLDLTNRDLASQPEIKIRNAETHLPGSSNQSLQNLSTLREAFKKKYN